MRRTPLVLLLILGLAGASHAQVETEDVFPDITFQFPVEVAIAPGQPDLLFVVEKGEEFVSPQAPSRILVVEEGDTQAEVFLDLSDKVYPGGEAGLFGLAFHPDYEANGKLYVYYTAKGIQRTVVEEYTRSSTNPLEADPASARVVIEVLQNVAIHNGGKIAFGPDGYLYIALGDGGGQGDPDNNGQDLTNLLSTVSRIDVEPSGGNEYQIPPDNPFVGVPKARPEIYAFGFRNPWKMGFDSETGDLWLGDVGQSRWEEVIRVEPGGNYGWPEAEANECHRPGCTLDAYLPPVYAYPHDTSPEGGFSISGGIVYRGSDLPGLQGQYLFADYVFPKLWALDTTGDEPQASLIVSSIPNVVSINEDASSEVLVTSLTEGKVYRLVPGVLDTDPDPDAAHVRLRLSSANPVRDAARLRLSAAPGTAVRVVAMDARGRELAVLFDGILSASEADLTLDARGLPAGAVFLRAQSGAGRAVLPLVVAR